MLRTGRHRDALAGYGLLLAKVQVFEAGLYESWLEGALAAYQALRDEKLAALPGVQRLTSTIVMKRIVDDRPYPTQSPPEGTHHRA